MPIYEYRCKKGHNFEVIRGFSDGPVTECEVCGASVDKVFHPIAVHFKGSGFYNTDYGTRKRSREMKESKDGSSNGSSESSKDGAAASKSDSSTSKPESGAKKTETKISSKASSGTD